MRELIQNRGSLKILLTAAVLFSLSRAVAQFNLTNVRMNLWEQTERFLPLGEYAGVLTGSLYVLLPLCGWLFDKVGSATFVLYAGLVFFIGHILLPFSPAIGIPAAGVGFLSAVPAAAFHAAVFYCFITSMGPYRNPLSIFCVFLIISELLSLPIHGVATNARVEFSPTLILCVLGVSGCACLFFLNRAIHRQESTAAQFTGGPTQPKDRIFDCQYIWLLAVIFLGSIVVGAFKANATMLAVQPSDFQELGLMAIAATFAGFISVFLVWLLSGRVRYAYLLCGALLLAAIGCLASALYFPSDLVVFAGSIIHGAVVSVLIVIAFGIIGQTTSLSHAGLRFTLVAALSLLGNNVGIPLISYMRDFGGIQLSFILLAIIGLIAAIGTLHLVRESHTG